MVVIEAGNKETLDMGMSNKTDKTMNFKDKPSMLHNYRAFHSKFQIFIAELSQNVLYCHHCDF